MVLFIMSLLSVRHYAKKWFFFYYIIWFLQPQYAVNYKIAYIYVLFIMFQAQFSELLYILFHLIITKYLNKFIHLCHYWHFMISQRWHKELKQLTWSHDFSMVEPNLKLRKPTSKLYSSPLCLLLSNKYILQ